MCLFPLPNLDTNGVAYKKGVHEFDCGACPECLRKRSSVWVLRSVMEARSHAYNCMVTLTYDNFLRDKVGNIVKGPTGKPLETPVNPDLKVNQRDVQLFIKRLRKWYSSISDEPIKYIACAEYGSHTHRAHYHLLLFGVRFPDAHFYKKSKRGNPIYMSDILTKLWSHGICTVDSINVHSSVAMYCTKYCAKSRSLDTFILCSQRIGYRELTKHFNGINYMIQGREYTIPRFIWQDYIMRKYACAPFAFSMSPRYVNATDKTLADGSFYLSQARRECYRMVRDSDEQYIRYLDYWQRRGKEFDQHKLDPRTRILQLDDRKLHAYKVKALAVFDFKSTFNTFRLAPGSRCGVSRYLKIIEERANRLGIRPTNDYLYAHLPLDIREKFTCRLSSRPNTASDTVIYNSDSLKVKIADYNSRYLTFDDLSSVDLSEFPDDHFEKPRNSTYRACLIRDYLWYYGASDESSQLKFARNCSNSKLRKLIRSAFSE